MSISAPEVNVFPNGRKANMLFRSRQTCKGVPSFYVTAGSVFNGKIGKAVFLNTSGEIVFKAKEFFSSKWNFSRLALSSLKDVAALIAANDGSYCFIAGDLKTVEPVTVGIHRSRDGKADSKSRHIPEEDWIFDPESPSPLIRLDVDEVEPWTFAPDLWPTPDSFSATDKEAVVKLARRVVDALAPGNGNAELVISATASHSAGFPGSNTPRPRLRIFALTDRPLTLKEQRAFAGPALGGDYVSSIPGLKVDPALTASVVSVTYLGNKAYVTDATAEGVNEFHRAVAERFNGSKVNAGYADYMWNLQAKDSAKAILSTARDPFAHLRVIHAPAIGAARIVITDDLVDARRIVKAQNRSSKASLEATTAPLTEEQRARYVSSNMFGIPWESGTYPALRDYLTTWAGETKAGGLVMTRDECLRDLEAYCAFAVDKARAAGKMDRAQVIAGYVEQFKTELDQPFFADLIASRDTKRGNYIDASEEDETDAKPSSAPPVPPFVSLAEAGNILEDVFSDFRVAVEMNEHPAPVVLAGSTGVGKSHHIAETMRRLVADLPGRKFAVIVPTHRLASQLACMIGNDIAFVYRGITHDDNQPGIKCKCAKPDIHAWHKQRSSMASACAGCQFFADYDGKPCPYPSQRERLEASRVHVYVGPAVIANPVPELARKPMRNSQDELVLPLDDDGDEQLAAAFEAEVTEMLSQYAGVIVDETAMTSWMHADKETVSRLCEIKESTALEACTHARLTKPTRQGVTPEAARIEVVEQVAVFNELQQRLVDAMSSDGIYRGTGFLADAGFTFDDLKRLRKACDILSIHGLASDAPLLFGKASYAEQKAARDRVNTWGRAARSIESTKEITEALIKGGSVRFYSTASDDEDMGGNDTAFLEWRYKADIHHHWSGVPLLVSDATVNRVLVPYWLPNADFREVLVSDASSTRRYFVTGDVPYGAFKRDKRGNRPAGYPVLRQQVQDMLNTLATGANYHLPIELGVVGPLDLIASGKVEADGVSDKVKPPVIFNDDGDVVYASATFGGMSGLNFLGNVDRLAIVGRQLANRAEIERLAGDIKGDTVIGCDPGAPFRRRYAWCWQRSAEGLKPVRAKCWQHEDPVADALLHQNVYAATIQADGRARSIRRDTASFPNGVEIYHLTSTITPGMVYDLLMAEFDGELVPAMLALDDFDHDSTSGRLVRKWFERQAGRTTDEWARMIGLDSARAFRDFAEKQTPAQIRRLAEIIAEDDRSMALDVEAESVEPEDDPVTFRGIIRDLLASGYAVEPASAKKLLKSDFERRCAVAGLEVKADTFRNSLDRELRSQEKAPLR